jgi:hypothetical protein
MSTEATWLHLSTAHGFAEWTDQDLAKHYPSFARADGRVDVVGLHQRDHQMDAGALDHEHQEEE